MKMTKEEKKKAWDYFYYATGCNKAKADEEIRLLEECEPMTVEEIEEKYSGKELRNVDFIYYV